MVINAQSKLASKKADWIHLVTSNGVEDWPEQAKEDVAHHLIARIAEELQ